MNSSTVPAAIGPSSTMCPASASTRAAASAAATHAGCTAASTGADVDSRTRSCRGASRAACANDVAGNRSQCGLPTETPAITSSSAAASSTQRLSGPHV
jgi:hypothetical protein